MPIQGDLKAAQISILVRVIVVVVDGLDSDRIPIVFTLVRLHLLAARLAIRQDVTVEIYVVGMPLVDSATLLVFTIFFDIFIKLRLARTSGRINNWTASPLRWFDMFDHFLNDRLLKLNFCRPDLILNVFFFNQSLLFTHLLLLSHSSYRRLWCLRVYISNFWRGGSVDEMCRLYFGKEGFSIFRCNLTFDRLLWNNWRRSLQT